MAFLHIPGGFLQDVEKSMALISSHSTHSYKASSSFQELSEVKARHYFCFFVFIFVLTNTFLAFFFYNVIHWCSAKNEW
jgi:hypothetical protein